MDAEQFAVLPAAPRYLRSNASRAMGGYLIRGLIELITNARDSAYRLYGRDGAQGLIHPIDIEYRKHAQEVVLIVRDRFEGMSQDAMQQCLLQYGKTSSGFQSESLVRGINARGAKDVAVLGVVHYRSIRDNVLSECSIQQARYKSPVSRIASTEDRANTDLVSGNGTVVTITPFQGVTVPGYEALVRDLERHVEIRYTPPGAPHIPIVIREIRRNTVVKESPIVGYQPPGEVLVREVITIPEFKKYGDAVELTVMYSPVALKTGGNAMPRLWRSEAGIMIVDGTTAHDVTWLRARGADSVAAQHLWGTLHIPHIPSLLREFEAWEFLQDAEPGRAPISLNPVQITDPDRFGLNDEHPFMEAIKARVRPVRFSKTCCRS